MLKQDDAAYARSCRSSNLFSLEKASKKRIVSKTKKPTVSKEKERTLSMQTSAVCGNGRSYPPDRTASCADMKLMLMVERHLPQTLFDFEDSETGSKMPKAQGNVVGITISWYAMVERRWNSKKDGREARSNIRQFSFTRNAKPRTVLFRAGTVKPQKLL